MTETEHARVARTVADLKARAGECLPFIRSLYDLGLIPGWRAVVKVYPRKESDHESAAAHV